MAPGLIYVFINNYIPMFGIVIAFKKVNFQKGIFASDWVGLENFKFLFTTDDAWIITRNTILYNLVFIVLNTVNLHCYGVMPFWHCRSAPEYLSIPERHLPRHIRMFVSDRQAFPAVLWYIPRC